MERILSPKNGDYSVDATVSGIQNAVYLRLMTPLGSYWANPSLGSKLHLLSREKDLTRIALLAKQYAEQALQPIIDDGRAQLIEVESVMDHDGTVELIISVVDSKRQKFQYNHYVRL